MTIQPTIFPAQPMTEGHANALNHLGMVFTFRGWDAQCRCCSRRLPITLDGQLIDHRPGCPTAGEQHPWARMRAILAGQLPTDEVPL